MDGPTDLTPLPPEAAVEEPPIRDEYLELLASGAVPPDVEVYADEDPEHLTDEALFKRSASIAFRSWEITDTGAAEWAAGHFTRHADALEELEREAKGFHARVDRWLEQNAAPHRRLKSFFEHKLLEWAEKERNASINAKGEAKVKSGALPSAAWSSRAGQDRLEVTDEAALIAWLEANITDAEDLAACVKTTKKPLLTGLKATVNHDANGKVFYAPTGESVPGVVFIPAEINYKVNPV